MARPSEQARAGLARAETRLLGTLRDLAVDGSLDPTRPSRLPGWTIGHVVTHIARNADAIAHGLQGALRGECVPRYPGGAAQRNGDIEAGATRSADELVADLTGAVERLAGMWEATADNEWSGSCVGPIEPEPVGDLVHTRWREVELHHSDLGLSGFSIDDWSPALIAAERAKMPAALVDGRVPEPIAVRSPHRQVAWFWGRYPVDEPSWDAAALDPSWRRPLTDDEIAALQQALTVFSAASTDLDLTTLGPETFPLDGFDDSIVDLRRRLVEGQGVVAWEGFPVHEHTVPELRAMWWGLARAIGTPVVQSRRGDLMGDVRDLGTGINGPAGRGYTSNTELNFHADASDVSSLFFLCTASKGGTTRIASSTAVHDRLARRLPDLLEILYRPLPCSWQGNQRPGDPGWYEIPVFGRVGTEISCVFVRTNILLAAENAGARELTDDEVEAVQAVVSTASEDDLWVERHFEPGAMLFAHSHTTFHSRTEFTDHPDEDRRRHLLRVWMSLPNNRALPERFGSFFANLQPGTVRGGYPAPSSAPVFTTLSA